MKPEQSVIDAVLIRQNEAWKPISVDAFFSLALSRRIQHIVERTVRFQRNGEDVDHQEALDELRRLQAAR